MFYNPKVKVKKTKKYIEPVLAVMLPVDQYPAQDFNKGLNGLPANDLTLLERAQSAQEVELILSRLQELRSQSKNVGKSDAELICEIVPRWVQTPSEIDKFMEYYYNNVVEPQLGKPAEVPIDKVPTTKLEANAEVTPPASN